MNLQETDRIKHEREVPEPEYQAQLEAASLTPTNVGGSDVVLTFDEPAAPGYRAYISNEAHSAVPANLETDEMRIAVFPEGSTEPTVYLALRGLVTSNAILQALQADVEQQRH